VLGSVATGVIAAVDVPVLVFGPNAAAPTRFARVLGCTDGSHFAEGAVAAGASLSQALGVPLWVVDVVDPGTADTPVVAALAARLGEVGVEAQWDTLHDRHADVGIARYAAEVEGTITALASHGRSGWRELLMGTVAAGVVRRASGPVLLVCPAATG
jgi:nucleotide-binding universal stress UspA family protein